MTVQEVANGLANLCAEGKFDEAVARYYSEDIVSVEPVGETRVVKGLAAVQKKGEEFAKTCEIVSTKITGPFVSETGFALRFTMEAIMKATGAKVPMDEMALYEVVDGKVVREEFFYNAPGM